ncbi:MAG: hypothetical protein IKT90_03355, partial [Clostridia bacterium]|nr:hypothetical protein [Clostridia bacterium]
MNRRIPITDFFDPQLDVYARRTENQLINREHPECDKKTGAVHSCGHNAQCAALLGVAAALTKPAVLEKLCGKIR